MSHSRLRVNHIGTLTCNGWIIVVDHEIPSHTRCQVDQYISPTVSNSFHRIFEQINVPATNSCFRVTDVDMNDRSASISSFYCGISHLFRCDWYVWMLADGVTGSSHRTGDDHFSVHLHGVLLITVLCSISFIFLILAVTSLLHLRPTILSRGIPVFFQNFLEFC